MPIDLNQAAEDFSTGASNNADKLVRNYVRKTGKLDAAKSDAAEKLFAEKIAKAVTNKSRQKGLARVSEADMNKAMQETGSANYRSGTGRSKDKWKREFQPFGDALNAIEGKYPARTADPMQNLIQRAGLVVKTMTETKARVG